jgi:tight adherence protein B
MPIIPLLIITGGAIFVIALVVLAFSGPSLDKSQTRRLSAIRDRHSDSGSNIIESQMRRIQMSRGTKMDSIATRLLPHPELMRKRIAMTGKSWTMGQYLMASCGIIVGVTLLLVIKGASLFLALVVGLFLGLSLPHFVVGYLIGARLKAFNARFPDAIDLMVRGLRSGLPISETLGIVSTEIGDPVGTEFRMVTDKIRIGRTMDAALQDMADRLGTPEFQFFCITLNIQRETGGNLSETLANLSDVLRKRAQMKLKIKALSSEAKASAYIVGSLPFLVFALIWMEDKPYLEGFFYKPPLMLAGMVAILMLLTGAGIMAKMINFEI